MPPRTTLRRPRGLPVAVLLVVLAVLAGCAGGNTRAIQQGTAGAVVPMAELPAADRLPLDAQAEARDYRIGPLDVLSISVFGVEDFTRKVRVNASGLISLPLVGAVSAGGRTVQELEAEIATRLRDGFLQDPQVSVFVEEFLSQRVTVEGAVNRPGIYPMTGDITLLQAIAMAEGLDRVANRRGVIIFRTVGGQRMAGVFDINMIRAGEVPDPPLYGEDVVVVDESGPRAAWRELIQSAALINAFRFVY
ncbi:MAG: polysaccharide biosynthesis/export family protein [Lysobacteraceae bacterium]